MQVNGLPTTRGSEGNLVAGVKSRLADSTSVFLEERYQYGGALTGIALTAVFRLIGAFTCLSRVCQNNSPVPGSKEPGTMRISAEIVNVAVRG